MDDNLKPVIHNYTRKFLESQRVSEKQVQTFFELLLCTGIKRGATKQPANLEMFCAFFRNCANDEKKSFSQIVKNIEIIYDRTQNVSFCVFFAASFYHGINILRLVSECENGSGCFINDGNQAMNSQNGPRCWAYEQTCFCPAAGRDPFPQCVRSVITQRHPMLKVSLFLTSCQLCTGKLTSFCVMSI